MELTFEALQAYLFEYYGNRANEQGMFMKLVEEIGEVAEVLNKRAGRKSADDENLQEELAEELADMIHYIMAIAAINHMDIAGTIVKKDKRAAVKYRHARDLETFLAQYEKK